MEYEHSEEIKKRGLNIVCRFMAEACAKNDLIGSPVYKAAMRNDFRGIKKAFLELPISDGKRLLRYLQQYDDNNQLKALAMKYMNKGY